MTKISLVMMASKPELMMQAVARIIKLVPNYFEFVIAASPKLSAEEKAKLEAIPRAKIIPGTDTTEQAGVVRYAMLDAAEGDWIINVDDDDLWYFLPVPAMELDKLDEQIGLCHGSTLFLRLYNDPKTEDAYLMKAAREIKTPRQASSLGGSFWVLRKKAWEAISPHLERIWWFSDWRIAYYLVHFGWQVHTTVQLTGVVRSFGSAYPTGEEWSWPNYAKMLAEKLSSSVSNA
jgi:hypothetical protein